MNFGKNFMCLLLVMAFSVSSGHSQNRNVPDLRQKLKLKYTFQTDDERLQYVVFTPDSNLILTSKSQGSPKPHDVKVWSVENGELAAKFVPCNGEGHGGRWFDETGDLLAVGCYRNGTGELWNIRKARKLKTFQTTPDGERLTLTILSPNGTRAVLRTAYGELTDLWLTETRTRIATLNAYLTKGTRDSYSVEFSPDSETVAVSYNADVYLWDARTGELIIRFIDTPENLKLPPDVKSAHRSITRQLLFTPDSRTLVTGSYDMTAKAWDVETGKLKHTFKGHEHKITALAISPDGRTLTTGSADERTKLWDMESGELLWTSSDHKSEVWKMFFSPDGKRLLTMTDKEIFMWETATGKLLGKMPSVFWQTFFSPDWKYVVTPGKKKGTVELYEFSE